MPNFEVSGLNIYAKFETIIKFPCNPTYAQLHLKKLRRSLGNHKTVLVTHKMFSNWADFFVSLFQIRDNLALAIWA